MPGGYVLAVDQQGHGLTDIDFGRPGDIDPEAPLPQLAPGRAVRKTPTEAVRDVGVDGRRRSRSRSVQNSRQAGNAASVAAEGLRWSGRQRQPSGPLDALGPSQVGHHAVLAPT